MTAHVITDPTVPVTDPTRPTPDPTGATGATGPTGVSAGGSRPVTVAPVLGAADPTAVAVVVAGGAVVVAGWLALGAGMSEEAPSIADRDDLVVSIAPGAAHGAPAVFLPAHAAIEIDAIHLCGEDPATINPGLVADQNRIPTVWGLFTHECAHAHHSRWSTPPATPAGIAQAAALLEESRIEAAQIRRRAVDRRWLRASAVSLILDEYRATTTDSPPEVLRHAAGQAAALLMARVDAGVLTEDETRAVTRAVTDLLGADTVEVLRGLWREAHTVADDDTAAMIELGARWCTALGLDPHTPHTPATPAEGGDPGAASAGPPGPVSAVSKAVRRATDRVARRVAGESAPVSAAEQAATDAARAPDLHTASAVVFPPNTDTTRYRGDLTLGASRVPTAAEQRAARVVGRAWDTAGVRVRVAVKTSSVLPPGRLSMRGARAADAQRAAGAIPTAAPFTRVSRVPVPTPPLRVGVACDVSCSMGAFTGPVASAAWILAAAAAHTRMAATTAAVLFGSTVRALTRPGQVPARVTEFDAPDRYEDVPLALDALDGVLGLSATGAARLLVIISDGCYHHRGRTEGQTRVTRLRAQGCAVLWLAPDRAHVRPLDGVTVEKLTDPATTAHTIARAATTALRAAR